MNGLGVPVILQNQYRRLLAGAWIVFNDDRASDAGEHFLDNNTIRRKFSKAMPRNQIVAALDEALHAA